MELAKGAFKTYLRSIKKQKDKEIFDLFKLPIDDFAASLGLPMTPKVRFIQQKTKKNTESEETTDSENNEDGSRPASDEKQHLESLEEAEDDVLFPKESSVEIEDNPAAVYVLWSWGIFIISIFLIAVFCANIVFPCYCYSFPLKKPKKKKLKINVLRPIGTRIKYDDEGNIIPPLAALADTQHVDVLVRLDKGLLSSV